MTGVEVSVLIVSYNTAELTVGCLDSLREQTRNTSYEVIVVDNASTDSSAARIRAAFPDIEVVDSGTNLGFGRAVNLAAERAKGEYLLLLNPDTVVLDDALGALLAFARAHPEHGIYGGRTLRPDGTLDPSSCWGVPTLWSLVCFGLGLSTWRKGSALFDPESLGGWRRDSVREVGVVTGCLLLVRRSVFGALGGFDPRYFMYGEDADLSVRARRADWRPVITPDATVIHHVGASSARRSDKMIMVMRAKVTFVRDHFEPGARRRSALALLTLGVAVRATLAVLTGWLQAVKTVKATKSLKAEKKVEKSVETASGRTAPTADAWVGVWKARREWQPGYPPAPVTGKRPATG